MTNANLRERFGGEEKNNSMATRIIKGTVTASLIHCQDETDGSKTRKYLPWQALE